MSRSLVALGLLAVLLAPVRAEIVEQVLVKVNGDIITKTDFEQRQITYLRQSNKQDVLNDDAKLKQALVEITPQLITEAVDELLLIQRGHELGIRMSDDQFQSILQNIKKENKIESEEQFQQALKAEGMSMDDLRRALEKQMIVSRVQQQEIFARISLTEEEERQYYRERPDEFRAIPSITLREIVVAVANPADGRTLNVGAEDDAKAKAEAARSRVQAGEDFAKVAAETSDAPSKANGGLVGPVNKTDLAPAFQDALTGLKPGGISGVFRTPRGYQLIQLVSATEANVQPFEQVRPQIAEKIYNQRRRGEFEKYLRKLRAEAIIEWKNEELKKAFEQRVAEMAVATPSL
jgi:peptidyl-prolyl cis-trans isomerase SurA